MKKQLPVWLGFALALVFLPSIFDSVLGISILNQMTIWIIFALSYNMLLGQGGMLSFGHAVYFGLGGFMSVHALNLIADGELLLGANLSSIRALKEGLELIYRGSDFKEVKKIPVISTLIADYFDGDLSAINGIKVSQPGGSFSQAAWKAMRRIRPGKVLSYAELAKNSGSPKAVRAAGSACAKNAIVLVVPCHRIVKTGGALGNYAYGVEKKEWLLSHESLS